MRDAQENSLQSQQDYFAEYIRHHPDWVFVGIYTDDGISGLSIRRRDGFNRMVDDALDGKIDLILTKSLSRFARNTVDALTTIRNLKAAGVAVYFQKENINTADSTGEFLITLMSSFAEEESRSISENVTWAVRHRYAQGIYYLSGRLLGYTHNRSGEIQVDEVGARVVRFIYLLPGNCDNDHSEVAAEWITPEDIADLFADVPYVLHYEILQRQNRVSKDHFADSVLSFLSFLSHGYKRKPAESAAQHRSLRRVSIWKIIIYRFCSYNDCRFAKPRVFSSWPQQIRAYIPLMTGNVWNYPCFSQKSSLERRKIKNYRC